MKHMWSEEEIQSFKKDISNLVDSKGNPRFIEGDGTPLEQEGVTISYCKWSLSGTHLIIVVAGTIANETTIPQFAHFGDFDLPNFILDKIVPVWGNNIETKSIQAYNTDWSSQTINIYLTKTDKLYILINNAFTANKERNFRLQFDLLIDNE